MTMTGEIQGTKKEFIKIFNEMCYSRSGWQVWSDLISTMACSIANAVDRSEPRFSNREKEYAHCIERLGGVDKPAKCFAIVVEALERNPEQDFQNHVLFVGQDIDRIVGMMCYIQLSLLGCAGYICIGNTITNPLVGHVLFPREMEGQELWITPMFQSNVWAWRRLFHSLGSLGGFADTKQTIEKEHYYMFFDFEKKEEMQWEQR